MRGRAAFSEQLAEDHLSDQVLPSFEELRVVHTDRFDKRFGRALTIIPRRIDQAAELNFVPTKRLNSLPLLKR
jgi:hypothetical protein